MARTKLINVKITKSGLSFTSAGVIRCGTVLKLPAAEATKMIERGYADKAIIRRKKKSPGKDVDSGDSGGTTDLGGKSGDQVAQDAPETGIHGIGVEHTDQTSHSNPVDDP